MAEFEVVDQIPPRNKHDELRAACKRQPGKWIVFPGEPNRTHWRSLGFQTSQRGGVYYVRWPK